MKNSRVRLRDPRSLGGESVLTLLDDEVPVTDAERDVVACIDGWRSIDEIARACGDGDRVRALAIELLWYRCAVIDEVITVDEVDVFDECEHEPTVFVLRRRRERGDSPLVRAILAVLARS